MALSPITSFCHSHLQSILADEQALKHSVANTLPADVINLILYQLSDLHETQEDSVNWRMPLVLRARESFQRDLRSLSLVNKMCKR